MKFFSIVLSLCLHLIVILLLVHFTCVSQKHTSKEEKLYKVSLVSLQEKKARKATYVKRRPTKKTKSVPKKTTKEKEIVAKPVPEKKSEEQKKVALPEKAKEEMYSKSMEEIIKKRMEGKKAAWRRKIKEEEKEMEREEERKKEEKREKIENEQKKQEEYDNCRESLQLFIEKHWFLNLAFIEKQNLKATVRIIVTNNGEIIKPTIRKSSGNKYFDDMALDAIKRSNPLPETLINLKDNTYLVVFDLKDYEKLHN